MALALLRLGTPDDEVLPAEGHLGSNRYYAYRIGGTEVRSGDQLPDLDDVVFQSPVLGPVSPSAMGHVEFPIPLERFDRDHRLVQLTTYRDAARQGPAIGDVVRYVGSLGGSLRERLRADVDPRKGDVMSAPARQSLARVPAVPPPYGMSLARTERSQALFLSDLLGAIGRVAPVIGQIFGAISGGARPAASNGAPASGAAPSGAAATGAPSPEELIRLLTTLLGQARGGAVAQSAALGSFSEAQVLPIAALMPLLSSVLTPDTMKALIGSLAPDKIIGAVSGGIKDIAKVGMENDKMFLDHLEKLNPGVNDPALDSLLASMSLSASPDPADVPYRRLTKVRLSFVDEATTRVRGVERVVYGADHDLRIQLSLDTPRPIGRATLWVVLREPGTREVLAKAKVALEGAQSGVLPNLVTLRASEIAGVRPGDEVLLDATLTWRTKSGERVGTSITRLCILASTHVFDRVEGTAEQEIPLTDVTKHRDAWHRVWQETLPEGLHEVDFECKYTVEVDPRLTKHARGDTAVRTQSKSEHRLEGRLTSGMKMSLTDLNRLLPTVSAHPSIPDRALDALRVEEFTAPLRSAARHRARLHGRQRSTLALWVFPVLSVRRVVLLKLGTIDDGGRVRSMTEEIYYVAVPTSVHFVGARSPR